MSLLVLRVGCVAILVIYHVWDGAQDAWHHVWHQEPWALVTRLAELDYPAPRVLAVTAATICALGAITIVLGFLTRLSALLVLFVILAAVPFGYQSGLPVHGEVHSFYILGFLLIVLLGGGRHALDAFFIKK